MGINKVTSLASIMHDDELFTDMLNALREVESTLAGKGEHEVLVARVRAVLAKVKTAAE